MQPMSTVLAIPPDFTYSCEVGAGEVTGITGIYQSLLYPFDGGPAAMGTRFYTNPVNMKIEVLRTGLTEPELRLIVEQATTLTQLTAESRYATVGLINVTGFDQMFQYLVNHSELQGPVSFQELVMRTLSEMGTESQRLLRSPETIDAEMRSVVCRLNELGVVLIQARSLHTDYPIRVMAQKYTAH